MSGLKLMKSLAVVLLLTCLACNSTQAPAPPPSTSAPPVTLIPEPAPSLVELDAPPPEPIPPRDPCASKTRRFASFTPDSRLLAIELEQGAVRVLETSGWKPVRHLKFGGELSLIAWSPDGQFLFGSYTPRDHPDVQLLRVLRVSDAKLMWQKPIRRDENSLVIASDSSWFAAVTPAGAPPDAEFDPTDHGKWHVELVELPGFSLRRSIETPDQVTELPHPIWKPRKNLPEPVGELDSTDIRSLVPIPNADADYSQDSSEPGECCELADSADSRTLSINYQDVTSFVDARDGTLMTTLSGSFKTFSPTGRFGVLARKSGSVAILDTRKRRGKLFYDALCDANSVYGAPDFNPGESLIALGGIGRRICLVAPTTGRLKTFFPRGFSAPTPELDHGRSEPGGWTADGSAIVNELNFRSELLRADTGREIYIESEGLPLSFTRRPDGSLIVYALNRGPIAEVVRQRVRRLFNVNRSCEGFEWSPDYERLLSGSDGIQNICSTRTFQVIARFKALGNFHFDPRGRWLYGGDRGHLSIWSATSGKQLFALDYCKP